MGLQFTENRQRNIGLSVSSNPRTVLSSVGLQEATQAEAIAGSVQNRYMSPLRTQQKLDDIDFTAGTGLSGGGTLGADRTFSVDFASQAEAEAGSSAVDVMSPVRTKNAIQSGTFFTQTGTGAANRTLIAKLKDTALTPQDFGAVGDSTDGTDGTDDTTALTSLVTAAIAQNKPIYIPEGGYRYSSTLAFTKLIPVFGDGKTRSRLFYTGAAQGVTITPPTSTGGVFSPQNDGHFFRDFSVEPSVDGAGTYGVEIIIASSQYYAYSSWERVRIGNFGTRSLYLNNTAAATDGVFTDTFIDCDFVNSVLGVKVGDNVHFLQCKVHGTTAMSFSMQSGARRLILNGNSITCSGGVVFDTCYGVHFDHNHVEIFSGTSYNGSTNALVTFDDVSGGSCYDNRIAKAGTGTKPNDAILVDGTSSSISIDGAELAQGNNTHIRTVSTTSDVSVGHVFVDEGVGNEVITLVGDRSHWFMYPRVRAVGNADATINPTDEIIVLSATLTANRTLTLPEVSDVRLGKKIVFIDAAGGIGSFSWIIARAGSSDTIQGAASVTLSNTINRFELIAVAANVWSYGVAPIIMGGTGASTASGARTNLGLGTAAVKNTGTSGDAVPLLNTGVTFSDQFSVTDTDAVPYQGTRYSDGATASAGQIGRKARGSGAGSETAVSADDHLCSLLAQGWHSGAAFSGNVGRVTIHAGEAFTGTNQGTYITLRTTPTGGGTSDSERARIGPTGRPYFLGHSTTASAANAFLDSGSTPVGELLRSTSSLRFKRDIQDLPSDVPDKLLSLRPIKYRSTAEADNPEFSWYGFAAEEVSQIDPRWVNWGYKQEDWLPVESDDGDGGKTISFVLRDGAEKVPDGVTYDRLVVPLLALVKKMNDRIRVLEAEASTRAAR